MIQIAPTGKLVQGHVFDVNRKSFERALKSHDSQLYTRWNPKKLHGWGCWEVRRKPAHKAVVDYAKTDSFVIIRLEAAENNVENHVLDAAFLNYDQIRKIKEMDTWNKDHWIHQIDYLEEKQRAKIEASARAELRYNLKNTRAVWKEFQELVKAGKNPARIITGMPV